MLMTHSAYFCDDFANKMETKKKKENSSILQPCEDRKHLLLPELICTHSSFLPTASLPRHLVYLQYSAVLSSFISQEKLSRGGTRDLQYENLYVFLLYHPAEKWVSTSLSLSALYFHFPCGDHCYSL